MAGTRHWEETAPWLGTDFWGEAMDYANERVARRPCRANPDNQVPEAMFRGVKTVRTDHLRQWGFEWAIPDA